MSLWRRLTRFLETLKVPRRYFQFDDDLSQSIEVMARQEQRSQDEVAADLLSLALAQHSATEGNLRYWDMLSPREQEVVALFCLGYSNREIARRLVISHETVKTHLHNAQSKFGLRNKAELRAVLTDWDFTPWNPES